MLNASASLPNHPTLTSISTFRAPRSPRCSTFESLSRKLCGTHSVISCARHGYSAVQKGGSRLESLEGDSNTICAKSIIAANRYGYCREVVVVYIYGIIKTYTHLTKTLGFVSKNFLSVLEIVSYHI